MIIPDHMTDAAVDAMKSHLATQTVPDTIAHLGSAIDPAKTDRVRQLLDEKSAILAAAAVNAASDNPLPDVYQELIEREDSRIASALTIEGCIADEAREAFVIGTVKGLSIAVARSVLSVAVGGLLS